MDSLAPPKWGISYTRRSFINRSGALGAVLVLAATGWEKTLGRVVAVVSPAGPSAKHRRTYVALAEAMSAHDPAAVPPASAAEVARRFDGWYAAQPSTTQRIADSLLEDVAAGFPGGAFHRAGADRRLAFVRLRATGSEGGHPAVAAQPEPSLAHQLAQIKANAAKPEYAADPTALANVKAVPLDGSQRTPARPVRTDAEMRRSAQMLEALALVYAPLYDRGPRSAIKPPPVRI